MYVQRMARDKASPKKNYGLRLDQGVMKELAHLAVDEDRWLNELVEEAVKDFLKKYREPSWNFPVVRFLDEKGHDLIPRKDKVYSTKVCGKGGRSSAVVSR